MFVPLVVTMTDDRISTHAMRCNNVCSPGVVTMTAPHRGLLAIMTQSVVTLSPAQCPLNTNFALCSCNKMFVIIHFNRIMLNCEMYKLKSILCIALVVGMYNWCHLEYRNVVVTESLSRRIIISRAQENYCRRWNRCYRNIYLLLSIRGLLIIRLHNNLLIVL